MKTNKYIQKNLEIIKNVYEYAGINEAINYTFRLLERLKNYYNYFIGVKYNNASKYFDKLIVWENENQRLRFNDFGFPYRDDNQLLHIATEIVRKLIVE